MKVDAAWLECKNLLCIRADNMGDLLMSSPAIKSLKKAIGCKITVLTSAQAAGLVPYLEAIDETIVADMPWVKSLTKEPADKGFSLVSELKKRNFDACVIFTVYSQSPLPAALLCYMAGIPRVLGYCRENPYKLLSNWVPDKEPYSGIVNQVNRDLVLLEAIGIERIDQRLSLVDPDRGWPAAQSVLLDQGVKLPARWIILHIGVSEQKRNLPQASWISLVRSLGEKQNCQILVTGLDSDRSLAALICDGGAGRMIDLTGRLSLSSFIALLNHSALVVSVNTATIHLAAALGKTQVVLYALTNPQHLPWKGTGMIIPFPIDELLQSKNEVIRFVNERWFAGNCSMPEPDAIAECISAIFSGKSSPEPFEEVLILEAAEGSPKLQGQHAPPMPDMLV